MDMKEKVKFMQDYWNAYTEQSHWEDYRPETFMDDALYAIGLCMNREEFEFHDGYDKFKKYLLSYINQEYQHQIS